jgi:hypothetical protein
MESKIICKGCKHTWNKVSIRKHLSHPTNRSCNDSYSSEEHIAFQNEADLRNKQKHSELIQTIRGTADPSLVPDDTTIICKVCQKPFKNIYMHLERDKKGCKDNYCPEDLTTLENDRKRKRKEKREEYKPKIAASMRAIRSSQSEPDKKKQCISWYLAKKSKHEMKPMNHHLWSFFKEGQDTPIFPCICCHKLKYPKGVVELTEKTRGKIDDDLFENSCFYDDSFKVRGKLYLCRNCTDLLTDQESHLWQIKEDQG